MLAIGDAFFKTLIHESDKKMMRGLLLFSLFVGLQVRAEQCPNDKLLENVCEMAGETPFEPENYRQYNDKKQKLLTLLREGQPCQSNSSTTSAMNQAITRAKKDIGATVLAQLDYLLGQISHGSFRMSKQKMQTIFSDLNVLKEECDKIDCGINIELPKTRQTISYYVPDNTTQGFKEITIPDPFKIEIENKKMLRGYKSLFPRSVEKFDNIADCQTA